MRDPHLFLDSAPLFSKHQLAYLRGLFPEHRVDINSTLEQVKWSAAQQQVLSSIEELTP